MAWESCPKALPASYVRPSLTIAPFSLLQIDFLSSLILRPELPSLGVVTISVSQRDGDSFQPQGRGSGWPSALRQTSARPVISCGQRRRSRCTGAVRAHCPSLGVRSGHERSARQQPTGVHCGSVVAAARPVSSADRAVLSGQPCVRKTLGEGGGGGRGHPPGESL